MKVKTRIKAGRIALNHNVAVKTRVKAGRISLNHNATVR
jgi:hypothetical protein